MNGDGIIIWGRPADESAGYTYNTPLRSCLRGLLCAACSIVMIILFVFTFTTTPNRGERVGMALLPGED